MKRIPNVRVDRDLRARCYLSAGSRRYFLASSSEISIHLTALIALAIFCIPAAAQNVERITKQEIKRREAALSRGQEALVRAKAAMAEKNFVAAHDEFRNAVTLLPDASASEGGRGRSEERRVGKECRSRWSPY